MASKKTDIGIKDNPICASIKGAIAKKFCFDVPTHQEFIEFLTHIIPHEYTDDVKRECINYVLDDVCEVLTFKLPEGSRSLHEELFGVRQHFI